GAVQRMFSAFPDGRPGVGLLLLRLAAGLTAIAQGAVHLTHTSSPAFGVWAIGYIAIASGAGVLVGFLTPGTGIALGLTIPLFWFPVRAEGVFLDGIAAALIVDDAAAIAFLGPGAFSIDARLFGRREILIAHEPSVPRA